MHIDKLDYIVNEYNNTYHRATKIKPITVKDNKYIEPIKEVNDEDSKSTVGDHVRISKHKSTFAKGYTPNWSEEVFVIKKVKNTVPWILSWTKLFEHFMGKNYEKKQIKT